MQHCLSLLGGYSQAIDQSIARTSGVTNFVSAELGHGMPRYLDNNYSGMVCEVFLDEINI